eukprot:CAMPEP_0115302086 /NCGR_PEP_ID=MMETSP0270-20121206/70198_1 /TAXON_ID=71861 /ORGANISM="Scrippsiella trochoidea, Strain CCMP3099" /LENGTH=166 /DNA_ID=CAMNT_0002719995 /DNA_START=138 /DNA_END=638 /DNA_ORIENTATION=+
MSLTPTSSCVKPYRDAMGIVALRHRLSISAFLCVKFFSENSNSLFSAAAALENSSDWYSSSKSVIAAALASKLKSVRKVRFQRRAPLTKLSRAFDFRSAAVLERAFSPSSSSPAAACGAANRLKAEPFLALMACALLSTSSARQMTSVRTPHSKGSKSVGSSNSNS